MFWGVSSTTRIRADSAGSGARCSAAFIVSRRRPISVTMPIFRRSGLKSAGCFVLRLVTVPLDREKTAMRDSCWLTFDGIGTCLRPTRPKNAARPQ